MEKKYEIVIRISGKKFDAYLYDTPTSKMIWESLPIESSANLWGEEIYFPIPVRTELDHTAKEVVELGDLGYWPPGNAFCIFFGKTPVSGENEIRPASPVNVIGKIVGELEKLKTVPFGAKVQIKRKEYKK